MELSEKIQTLRKERGLTQEQFAQQLFVSRTAVSKWETGRGTPSIDSLQMIAKLCGVSLDALLGTEEAVAMAKEEHREDLGRFGARVDGMLDLAAVAGLVLPLYKLRRAEIFYCVPLWQLGGWQAALYWVFPLALALCGGAQLALSRRDGARLRAGLRCLGMALNALGIFLLILGGQPYPAVLYFSLFLLKTAVAGRSMTPPVSPA